MPVPGAAPTPTVFPGGRCHYLGYTETKKKKYIVNSWLTYIFMKNNKERNINIKQS